MTFFNLIKQKNKYNEEWLYTLIFLIPLIFNPFGNIPYEIPKVAYLIIFTCIGITLLVLSILLNKKYYFNKNVFLVIGLWILSFLLSTIFSISPYESFWGSYVRMGGLFIYIYYFLHFFICLQIFRDVNIRKLFYAIALFCGVLVSIYAIMQYFKIDPIPIGNIDLFNGRPYSTIGQPNMLGQWLIFPFFIAFFNISKDKNKWIYGIIFILIGIALYLTMNRATFIGIFISFILLGFYYLKGTYKKIFSISIIIAGILFAVFLANSSLRSLTSRFTLWKESAPLITNNILIGSGPETYYQGIQEVLTKDIYETESLYDMPDRIHNETYQILLDQGIFGLILYIILLIFLARLFFNKKLKSKDSYLTYFALIASYISLQFSFSFSAQMIYLLAFWAILLHEVIKFKKQNVQLNSKILKTGLISMLIIFSIFSFNYSINIVKADYLFQKSLSNFFVDKELSWNLMNEAINLNPYNSYYYNMPIGLFGNDYYISEHPDKKDILERYDYKMALITNKSFEYYLASAKLYQAIGTPEDVQNKFNMAIKKAPSWTLTWQNWGEYLMKQGEYNQAIEKFEVVIDLAPDFIWEESEKTRIFKKSNELFYSAVVMLNKAYESTNQEDKSKDLEPIMP